MFIESCARGVVLLLLVSSSLSRSLDDTPRTQDAAIEDPVRTSAQHRSLGGVGRRFRRENPAPEDTVEHDIAAAIGDEQRIDEGDLEGVNTTSDVKESKYGFGFLPSYGQCRPQYVFLGASTTAAPTTTHVSITLTNTVICQQLATNAGITGPTALQTYLQQCAALLSLLSAATTTPTMTTAAPTVTPPISSTCQLLAASAGITAPAALQTYLQQCALLLGLVTAPTTAVPTTTVAPMVTPPISSTCQLLAASAGITAPAALQTYLQQCALLLGLVTAPTTAVPTTSTVPTTSAVLTTTAGPTTSAVPTTTVAPTVTPAISSTCQLLAASSGITAAAALQTYLQQCALLIGLISG